MIERHDQMRGYGMFTAFNSFSKYNHFSTKKIGPGKIFSDHDHGHAPI